MASRAGWPRIVARPASAGTSPSAARRSVDLPEPFGPTIAESAPAGNVASTSQSTGRAPYDTMCASSIAGTACGAAMRVAFPGGVQVMTDDSS